MSVPLSRFNRIARAFRNVAFVLFVCFWVLFALAGNQWRPLSPDPATGHIYAIRSKGGIVYVQRWLYEVDRIAPWGLQASLLLSIIGIWFTRDDLTGKR